MKTKNSIQSMLRDGDGKQNAKRPKPYHKSEKRQNIKNKLREYKNQVRH